MMSKELKIGLLTLTGIVVAYFGFNYLKGSPLLNNGNIFYSEYSNVDGLHVGSKVVLNGFPIGRVNEIYLSPSGSNTLIVKYTVNNPDIVIPQNTIAAIISTDLFGSKAINLNMGSSAAQVQSGDTLAGTEAGGMFDEIEKKIEPYEQDFQDLKTKLDTTLLGLNQTIATLNEMLSAEGQKIAVIMSNVASITNNLEANNAHISGTLENMHSLSDSLTAIEFKEMLATADSALTSANQAMAKLNSDSGTVGKLLNDSSLYYNLNQSSIALEALLVDLKANPKRYVQVSLIERKDKSEKKNKKKKEEENKN